jgi:hypothetical protein
MFLNIASTELTLLNLNLKIAYTKKASISKRLVSVVFDMLDVISKLSKLSLFETFEVAEVLL